VRPLPNGLEAGLEVLLGEQGPTHEVEEVSVERKQQSGRAARLRHQPSDAEEKTQKQAAAEESVTAELPEELSQLAFRAAAVTGTVQQSQRVASGSTRRQGVFVRMQGGLERRRAVIVEASVAQGPWPAWRKRSSSRRRHPSPCPHRWLHARWTQWLRPAQGDSSEQPGLLRGGDVLAAEAKE
jgi:hypothetical protein